MDKYVVLRQLSSSLLIGLMGPIFYFLLIKGGNKMYKLTLEILINPKDLYRELETTPNFWKGYISQVQGHKVVSANIEKIKD